jgi:hypothetical protein
MAARWVFYYNVSRPHMGGGMAGHPPLGVLQAHGFSGAERIALFPPLLLDPIADALLLACDPEGVPISWHITWSFCNAGLNRLTFSKSCLQFIRAREEVLK